MKNGTKAEVTHFAGKATAPQGIAVFNPAFDVTPHEYVSAIITEYGVLRAPYDQAIAAMRQQAATCATIRTNKNDTMTTSMIPRQQTGPRRPRQINWVKNFMPVLSLLDKDLSKEQPLKGKRIVITMHLEAKTAYLALVLKNAGAGSHYRQQPLSTQDDVAAALSEQGVSVSLGMGCTDKEYETFLHRALDTKPDIIVDDGGDLVSLAARRTQRLGR